MSGMSRKSFYLLKPPKLLAANPVFDTEQSDFVLIILKRLLVARPDLKVILMSASVYAHQVADYFGSETPVCHIPGRLHPVEEYYLEDVIEAL